MSEEESPGRGGDGGLGPDLGALLGTTDYMICGARDQMKLQGPLFKNFQVGDSRSIQLSLGPFLRLCPVQLHR